MTRGDVLPAGTVVAWSPLHNGLLTGKYLPENNVDGDASRLNSPMMKAFATNDSSNLTKVNEATNRVVREVAAVSNEIGATPAQVALAWLRHRSVPVIPIIGAKKLSQLQDNLGSVALKFSPEQLDRLETVSAVLLGFPHDLLSGISRQMVFGGLRDRIAV